MTTKPLICFGQQPCGFFPRRFLFAKIQTARRLRAQLGGEIVFFYHDSDHDPRETTTILRHRRTGEALRLNFAFANKWQRKFSPLFAKRIAPGWRDRTALQLPSFVDARWVEAFQATDAANPADFCLEMYRRMGLLEGVRVERSGDPAFRRAACAVADFFVDVKHEGELVRARCANGELTLHQGGDSFITLPRAEFGKEQISPTRDSRLRWMQSVIHCTHYVAGAGERAYLCAADAPEITFVNRDPIDRSDEAYTEIPA
ncbi:MAG: hypothetical protein ABSG04_10845 [Verrucomicrobiota bacterium]|jgi:hypothetical protein